MLACGLAALELNLIIALNYCSVQTQCSEICGVYHGFMPIAVDSLSIFEFLTWLNSMGSLIIFKKNPTTTKNFL